MHNKKTRKLTITAMLTAITFLIGLTPIGYITLPTVSMTLLCIPVIIGTVVEGLGTGIWISLAFGLTSFFKAIGLTMVPDALGTYLLQISVFRTLVCIFIPRLLIPVTTFFVYRAVTGESRKRQRAATGIAALTGSITNTILFLGTMYLLFLPEIDQVSAAFGVAPEALFGALAGIGAVNGLPEAAVAVVLCLPIVWALTRNKTKLNSKTTEK